MQAAIDFRSADRARWTGTPGVFPPAALDFDDLGARGGLQVRVLRTALERQAIAGLRRHAAFGVENDLGLGLQPFEQTRDEIGHVSAVYRNGRVLASARGVPTGYGLTGAERLFEKVAFDASILGEGSWEIGRMIMEPEDRHPEVLQDCLAACLEELIRTEDVRHMHATTTLAMARLWRRVGLRTVVGATGASGTRYCLVHARVEDVMAALNLPHHLDSRPAALSVSTRRGAGPLALHA